jgi:hypothetical protein
LINILEVLFRIMKHGYWKEKCEASKAVLYLFRTFDMDLKDPVETIILPQLEFLSDPDWQFRAQLCTNLSGYAINHPDVLFSLICRLNDRVDAVK